MAIFQGFGQLIDSTLAVPGALPQTQEGDLGLGIKIRELPTQSNVDAPLYLRRGDALIFSAANVATYHCQPTQIAVSPCPGADAEWVAALLVATALPAVLWMQGQFVLHAAAVVPKGATRALAIAGPSGIGKSLLASQLMKNGAGLLADDSVSLNVGDGDISANGLSGCIHQRIGQNGDRLFEPMSSDQTVASAPLGAIIILAGANDHFEATALGSSAALELILANQHRPRIPAMLGRLAPVLAQATTIAERTPVFVWRRSPNQVGLSPFEQESLDTISKHLGVSVP